MRRRISVMVVALAATACGGEDESSEVTAEARTFVGEATRQGERVLVGVTFGGDDNLFFACGDKLHDPYSPYAELVLGDGEDPQAGLRSNSGSGWKLEIALDGTTATGNAQRSGEEGLDFVLTEVENEPGGPGLYIDDEGCLIGAVVLDAENHDVQGSSCVAPTAENEFSTRMQVTPLNPADDGWLVELKDTLEQVVLDGVNAVR